MARHLTLSLLAAVITLGGSAQLQWTGFYIGADADVYRGVVHVGGGYTYSAGYTVNANGDRDILVSYRDDQGNSIWDYTWNGTANGDDEAFDLAATDVGNVVVVGRTYVGAPDDYAAVVLYIEWTENLWCSQQVNLSPGYPDAFCHVVIPATGDDIFAAGYSQSNANESSRQWLLGRWDQNCIEQYSYVYPHGYQVDGFAVDASYNAYVASTQSIGGDVNIVIGKIDPAGSTSWVQTYPGLGFEDGANDLSLGYLNSIYVAGYRSTSAAPGSKDLLLAKYDLLGNFGYDYTFDQGGDDEGTNVLEAYGFPVVAGTTQSPGPTGRDGFVAKLDNLGAPFWTVQYTGPEDDEVRDLEGPNSVGDVTIVGHLSNSPPGFGIWVVDASGTTLWSNVYHGTGNEAIARCAAINNFDGCVMVAGHARTDTSAASSDAIVRKYCVTVGMEENASERAAGAWPNPFTDALWLDLPLPQGTPVEVEVVDGCGRLQHHGVLITGSPVDLGALADGAYLIRWRVADQAGGWLHVLKAS